MIIEEKDYNEVEAINYSTLSAMMKDPMNLIAPKEPPSSAMLLGSLVDDKLFSSDTIEDKYYFTDVTVPGEKMGLILNNYIENKGTVGTTLEEIDRELVLKARKEIGFQPSWGDEAILKNFIKDCGPYFEELIKANNRQIVSKQLSENADKTITLLQTCPYFNLSTILKEKSELTYLEEDKVSIMYQVPIVVDLIINNVEYKIKIKADIIVTNYTKHTITVYDLKVIGDHPRSLAYNWIKYGYYIQAALYSTVVDHQFNVGIANSYEISFKFIVSNPNYSPIILNVPDQFLLNIFDNDLVLINGDKIKSIVNLIQQYTWHTRNKIYDYTPDEYAGISYVNIPIGI